MVKCEARDGTSGRKEGDFSGGVGDGVRSGKGNRVEYGHIVSIRWGGGSVDGGGHDGRARMRGREERSTVQRREEVSWVDCMYG